MGEERPKSYWQGSGDQNFCNIKACVSIKFNVHTRTHYKNIKQDTFQIFMEIKGQS